MSATEVKRRRSPLIIGLLGGIGSGKSTVARLLGELGASIFNADQVANELLHDAEVERELRRAFGPSIFSPAGRVDRGLLGQVVFGSQIKLQQVNSIIHPLVVRKFEAHVAHEMARPRPEPIVLDAPLLLESALKDTADVLLFVEAPASVRRERVVRNRGWSEDEIERREGYQLGLAEKKKQAHYIVQNDGSLDDLEREVKLFWHAMQECQSKPDASCTQRKSAGDPTDGR